MPSIADVARDVGTILSSASAAIPATAPLAAHWHDSLSWYLFFSMRVGFSVELSNLDFRAETSMQYYNANSKKKCNS